MPGKGGARGGRRYNSGRKPKFDASTPLSRTLREVRVAAGLSGADLGRKLGASYMKVSRIETGTSIPEIEVIDTWLGACGASGRRKDILALRQDQVFSTKNRWDDQIDVVRVQEEVGRIVSSVDEIFSYCDFVIPGLLQTPEYTASLFRIAGVLDTRALEKAVVVRQQWRKRGLAHTNSLRFVIGETALRRPFGTALPGQLESLAADSQKRGVEVKVLAADVPVRTVPMHSFTVFGQELVTIETFVRPLVLREQRDIESFREIFEQLAKDALPFGEAIELTGVPLMVSRQVVR